MFFFYFYKKCVLNYRLGYKQAAKRYFKNIKDDKILKSEIYLYLDIFGEGKINTLDNLDDIQKETLRFGFFIQKNNRLKSKEILYNLKEMIDETGTNDIYNQIDIFTPPTWFESLINAISNDMPGNIHFLR